MCVNPKYNIRKRLLKLPGDFLENRYKLCIAVGISDKTLTRWMALLKTDNYSIAMDKFYLMSHFFDCNPTDLINYEPSQKDSQTTQL
jgi:DNA-binding Xre family transcriptional regulator